LQAGDDKSVLAWFDEGLRRGRLGAVVGSCSATSFPAVYMPWRKRIDCYWIRIGTPSTSRRWCAKRCPPITLMMHSCADERRCGSRGAEPKADDARAGVAAFPPRGKGSGCLVRRWPGSSEYRRRVSGLRHPVAAAEQRQDSSNSWPTPDRSSRSGAQGSGLSNATTYSGKLPKQTGSEWAGPKPQPPAINNQVSGLSAAG
jgi:hypothetical protein